MSYINPFSRTRKSTNPSTSGSFHSSFITYEDHHNGMGQAHTHIDLFRRGDVRVLEKFLCFLPRPLLRYLHTSPFFLPVLSIPVLFGSNPAPVPCVSPTTLSG